jgi:thioredoxin-like negative regulator of GroEL
MIGPLALAALLTAGGGHGRAGTFIKWERQFDVALKKAQAAQKPVFVDFWADWCGWCHELDRTTYRDPLVVRLASDFVPLKLDTEAGPKEAALSARYGVSSLPTMAFLSPAGRLILRVDGYRGPGQFPHTLTIAKSLAADVMKWEAALERDTRDAEALSRLGHHLFEQESYEESRELLERAVREDAELPVKDRKKSRMLLGVMENYSRNYAASAAILKDALAVKPPHEYDAKILYVLGRTYLAAGRSSDARAAFQDVVRRYPDSSVAQKAREGLTSLERRAREER